MENETFLYLTVKQNNTFPALTTYLQVIFGSQVVYVLKFSNFMQIVKKNLWLLSQGEKAKSGIAYGYLWLSGINQ